MMYWTDSELRFTDWLLMGLSMVVFWVGLIALAVLVVRQLAIRGQWGRPGPAKGVDPLQLLGERLARGDIDPEEYLRRRELLSGAGRDVGNETR
jgi:putative membrane protein